uniref:Uncharacterized protein n=1 Tax=viral metagenome TaxID=1070528 RepID=A0A6C0HG15_9ZZZZ
MKIYLNRFKFRFRRGTSSKAWQNRGKLLNSFMEIYLYKKPGKTKVDFGSTFLKG